MKFAYLIVIVVLMTACSVVPPEVQVSASAGATRAVLLATPIPPTPKPTTEPMACTHAVFTPTVYDGPGVGYHAVDRVPSNVCIEITARTEEGDWFQLSDGNWIHARDIVNAGPLEQIPVIPPAAVREEGTCMVIYGFHTGTVVVRTGPGTSFPESGTLGPGTIVRPIGRSTCSPIVQGHRPTNSPEWILLDSNFWIPEFLLTCQDLVEIPDIVIECNSPRNPNVWPPG